jgi:hypothetical protein
VDRTAGIAGIDFLVAHPLADKKHAEFEIGDEHCAGLPQDIRCIADMVAVAMGQKNVRHILGGLFPGLPPGRIVGEIGVDQYSGVTSLDAERGMSKPGDLHVGSSPRFSVRRRIEREAAESKGKPSIGHRYHRGIADASGGR